MDQIIQQIKNVEDHLGAFDTPRKAFELIERGKKEEAIKLIKEYLELNPSFTAIHGLLANISKYKTSDDPHIIKMEKLLREEEYDFKFNQICDLHMALGHAYNQTQDYDLSFIHYRKGNDLIKTTRPYDQKLHEELFEELKISCNSEFIEHHKDSGLKGVTPIFIVGMPKTGTSLLDQILDSHKDIYGAGELISMQKFVPFRVGLYAKLMKLMTPTQIRAIAIKYMEALEDQPTKNKYIVNKMPSNFLQLPLIKAAFPDAKIIHTTRDPMDICFSCYKERFVNGQDWSFTLEDIAHYYNLYNGLMKHYTTVMGDYIFDTRYENVVNDLEGTLRGVLDFCGLDWDENCLSFYKTKRNIHTPGFMHASQPLFTGSIGAWKYHADNLHVLKNTIQAKP